MDSSEVYELHAVVSSITDASAPKGHVVFQGRVDSSRLSRSDGGEVGHHSNSSWFLFNDFHVLPISKYEAAHINSDWKIPSVLVYLRRDALEKVKVPEFVAPVTEEVLFANSSKTNHVPKSFTPISRDALPKPGDQLAIDTEFVKIRDVRLKVSQKCLNDVVELALTLHDDTGGAGGASGRCEVGCSTCGL
jgi:PAB-dependent poly(A)-specific ribonuclease subunit 2